MGINPKTGFVTGKGAKNKGISPQTGTVSGPTNSASPQDETGSTSISPQTGTVSGPTSDAIAVGPWKMQDEE